MVVRSWSELDFDNVCSNAKVFGFDLDNTLASSKQPMKPAMIERFCALLDHTVVALISGGGMAVVTSQVLDVLTPNVRRGNLHVMPTSGSRYYRWDGTQWALVYAHDLSEATVAAVSESLERHARELGLWEQQVWGPRIENRGSQITFSALGQFASVAAKQAWDRDNTKKQALVEAVKADLPHMRVAAADTLGAADLLRDDHPSQLIDAADDSGCFHLCTILPILHFPMLCSYYVEAAGKYTPDRPVFAKQGRL